MSEENKKNFVLNEDELSKVPGGATQNRYDPKVCCNYTKVEYRCVGFLEWTHCDHYRIEKRNEKDFAYHSHRCVMGRFNYTEEVPYNTV